MIEVADLRFRYPGNPEPTLTGFDFKIEQGEIFGFLGPSGAGKSTTQKIIIGVLKQYSGQVQVFGKELRNQRNDYYEKIGVEFEFPNLFTKLTALENLKFFASLYSGDTEAPLQLLEMVGLADDADSRVAAFSKGMKMRLNFVRALLNKPELIFLDEPTAGLDPVNAKNIKNLILEKKAAGKTIFLTTHNMSVADEVCDRVAFIVDGAVTLIDSPRELKVRNSQKTVRVEYRENGNIESREFDLKGLDKQADFFALIRDKDIETIHTQEASLEDIFIQVTGRRLV